MEQIVLDKNDELVMKLLHYFITEMEYSPIILHGAKDEIWLEKMTGDYQIVRIVTNYIHNDEQMKFDLFRTRQIMKQIKKKTLSFEINTLSLFVNLGDNVVIDNFIHTDGVDCVKVNKLTDLKKYDFIQTTFPNILSKTTFKEKGANLFMKITNEISKKNEIETIKNEEVFKIKKPYVTLFLMLISFIVYLLCSYNPNLVNNLVLTEKKNILTIFTSPFVHFSIFQLIMNAYTLYIVGSQLESFLGKFKFAIICLISLLGSNLLSLAFINVNIYVIGLSGIIFGIFGAILYFGYYYRVYLATTVRYSLLPVILLNLLVSILLGNITLPIGGIIAGALATMALGVKYKSNKLEKINGIILTVIYITFLVLINV